MSIARLGLLDTLRERGWTIGGNRRRTRAEKETKNGRALIWVYETRCHVHFLPHWEPYSGAMLKARVYREPIGSINLDALEMAAGAAFHPELVDLVAEVAA